MLVTFLLDTQFDKKSPALSFVRLTLVLCIFGLIYPIVGFYAGMQIRLLLEKFFSFNEIGVTNLIKLQSNAFAQNWTASNEV